MPETQWKIRTLLTDYDLYYKKAKINEKLVSTASNTCSKKARIYL